MEHGIERKKYGLNLQKIEPWSTVLFFVPWQLFCLFIGLSGTHYCCSYGNSFNVTVCTTRGFVYGICFLSVRVKEWVIRAWVTPISEWIVLLILSY